MFFLNVIEGNPTYNNRCLVILMQFYVRIHTVYFSQRYVKVIMSESVAEKRLFKCDEIWRKYEESREENKAFLTDED